MIGAKMIRTRRGAWPLQITLADAGAHIQRRTRSGLPFYPFRETVADSLRGRSTASDGLRRAVEVIQAGMIGQVEALHVWSNRPFWPQGVVRPATEDPVPDSLNWDCWLGPALERPYKKDVYHTFAWRGWYEFGTGALGDMACHTVNMPFRALKLGYPTVVEYELGSRIYPETLPKTSRIRFEFPEREGLPPLKFWWYDGNPGDALKPLRPEAGLAKEIVAMRDGLPGSGCLIVGDKGKIFHPSLFLGPAPGGG